MEFGAAGSLLGPINHAPSLPSSSSSFLTSHALSVYKAERQLELQKKQCPSSFGPWRVSFTQNLFSNGPRRLAFPPPASPTELNWVLPNTRRQKVSIKHSVQQPATEGWQLFQQAVLSWRPPTTTEGALALRPAAALVAVRSTAERSSPTIQDSPSRTLAIGGPVSSLGSSLG